MKYKGGHTSWNNGFLLGSEKNCGKGWILELGFDGWVGVCWIRMTWMEREEVGVKM